MARLRVFLVTTLLFCAGLTALAINSLPAQGAMNKIDLFIHGCKDGRTETMLGNTCLIGVREGELLVVSGPRYTTTVNTGAEKSPLTWEYNDSAGLILYGPAIYTFKADGHRWTILSPEDLNSCSSASTIRLQGDDISVVCVDAPIR